MKKALVKDKSELIQKDAVISEYDFRVSELEDELALQNSDFKQLHEDMVAMQIDFDNAEK